MLRRTVGDRLGSDAQSALGGHSAAQAGRFARRGRSLLAHRTADSRGSSYELVPGLPGDGSAFRLSSGVQSSREPWRRDAMTVCGWAIPRAAHQSARTPDRHDRKNRSALVRSGGFLAER